MLVLFFFSLPLLNICDWQIKFFTAEIGLFVRHLRYFSNIENVRINRQSVDLLREAHAIIGELFENLQVDEMPDQSVVDLIFDFDERQYCLRRFLECRLCCVSICANESNKSIDAKSIKMQTVCIWVFSRS